MKALLVEAEKELIQLYEEGKANTTWSSLVIESIYLNTFRSFQLTF